MMEDNQVARQKLDSQAQVSKMLAVVIRQTKSGEMLPSLLFVSPALLAFRVGVVPLSEFEEIQNQIATIHPDHAAAIEVLRAAFRFR